MVLGSRIGGNKSFLRETFCLDVLGLFHQDPAEVDLPHLTRPDKRNRQQLIFQQQILPIPPPQMAVF